MDTFESWEDVKLKQFSIKSVALMLYTIAVVTPLSLELKCLVVEAARQTCLFKFTKKKAAKALFKTSEYSTTSFGRTVSSFWLQDSLSHLQQENVLGINEPKNLHVLLLERTLHFMADCYVINTARHLATLKDKQQTDWEQSTSQVMAFAQHHGLTDLTAAAHVAEHHFMRLNLRGNRFRMDLA